MRVSAFLLTLTALGLAAAAPTDSEPPGHQYWGRQNPPQRPRSVWHRPGWKGGNHGKFQSGEPSEVAKQRAAAVKDAFEFAWHGYYKYAFPNDQLKPVNNTHDNPFAGWGASAADALSTSLVMEIPYIVNEIIRYIPTIDWSKSYQNEQVSLFETTIRYIGGLLSGYDLLSGPLAHLANNPDNIPSLLEQAQNLANNLSFAFDTPTGIPSNNLYLKHHRTDGSDTNGLATIGTLVLEWTHLSDLTGNDTYGELAQTGESYLLNPQPVREQMTRNWIEGMY